MFVYIHYLSYNIYMNKSNKPIRKYIVDFLEWCEIEKGLSSKTQENYSNFLKKFLEFLNISNQSELKPHQLNSEIIWNYRLFLSKQKDERTGKLLKKLLKIIIL